MSDKNKQETERQALDSAIDSIVDLQLRVPADVADYLAYSDLNPVDILKQALIFYTAHGKLPSEVSAEEIVKKPMLLQADALINGERQKDYGDKLQNFAQIAMGFQMILAPKLQATAEITAEDVALCMMQVKIARLTKSPDHKDSILDVAGYAGCYDKIQEEREQCYPLKGATYDAGRKSNGK